MTTRTWLVRWIYMTVAAHLVVGVLLPLCAGAAITDGYRRGIEDFFFGVDAPAAGKALHVWWISLFGPTVQAAAIWMAGLAVMLPPLLWLCKLDLAFKHGKTMA